MGNRIRGSDGGNEGIEELGKAVKEEYENRVRRSREQKTEGRDEGKERVKPERGKKERWNKRKGCDRSL